MSPFCKPGALGAGPTWGEWETAHVKSSYISHWLLYTALLVSLPQRSIPLTDKWMMGELEAENS